MVNFTLKGPRAKLNPQDLVYNYWKHRDSIYKKDTKGHYWPITCLQSIPHAGHPYYIPIDTPFVEEKEFLTFYLDYLISLDAFRFVTLSWEREDMIKIEFDPTKVSYDYLVILNSLLRNCHAYWHAAYQFHKFSSWELNVDPLKLLVLSHWVPFEDKAYGWTPILFTLNSGLSVRPNLNGSGHCVIYASLILKLADPDVTLVNPFDSCNETKKPFSQRKQMEKDGYKYFASNEIKIKDIFSGFAQDNKKYPDWLTKEQVKRILNV